MHQELGPPDSAPAVSERLRRKVMSHAVANPLCASLGAPGVTRARLDYSEFLEQ